MPRVADSTKLSKDIREAIVLKDPELKPQIAVLIKKISYDQES